MIPGPITNYLFLDIETVSSSKTFSDLSNSMQQFWAKKAQTLSKYEDSHHSDYNEIMYSSKAGIFAEFSKIVCISIGAFFRKDGELHFKVKSFKNNDEADLIAEFFQLMEEKYSDNEVILCGHNIREFDIPFICRRALVNRKRIPELFNFMGKKPWEITKVIDTMEIWKFGDYKNFTSLDLMAHLLQIPSPKNDLSGEKVGQAYWEENRLEDIVKYCEKDVITVGRLIQRILDEEIIDDTKIIYIKDKKTQKENLRENDFQIFEEVTNHYHMTENDNS